MTLHLKKLSVGSENIDGLNAWHAQLLAREGRVMHVTRAFPRRAQEVLNGGSIYWIIKGWMCARQPILDLVEVARGDNKPACGIVLKPGLIPLAERKMRPFQGWRYLPEAEAPPDLAEASQDEANMPRALREELQNLGLL